MPGNDPISEGIGRSLKKKLADAVSSTRASKRGSGTSVFGTLTFNVSVTAASMKPKLTVSPAVPSAVYDPVAPRAEQPEPPRRPRLSSEQKQVKKDKRKASKKARSKSRR